MTSELVKRLRKLVNEHSKYYSDGGHGEEVIDEDGLTCKEAADALEAYETKLAIAVEALAFYAEADNYDFGACLSPTRREQPLIDVDEGVKAREALARIKNKETK